MPSKRIKPKLPTLRVAIQTYCDDKRLKPKSRKHYESILRVHFGDWMDMPVSSLADSAFADDCLKFAKRCGNARVEVGRGLVGALMKYLNAVHGLTLVNPFINFAAAGLLPERAKPRERRLQDEDLPAWRAAVDKLPEKQRDFLLLSIFTGLRRNECADLTVGKIDLVGGVVTIPDTKNGKTHTLPITPVMREILERRCAGLGADDVIFKGVCADHLWNMAMRVGSPRFMLHDLRKVLATVGERVGVGDTALRRILNHTAPKSDVLHKHYVSLSVLDVAEPLRLIQEALIEMMDICSEKSK